MNRDYSELTRTIKALRQKKGLNQAQAAEKMGITKQTLCSWEKNPEKLTIDKLTIMLSVYDIEVGEFFRALNGIFFNTELESNEK